MVLENIHLTWQMSLTTSDYRPNFVQPIKTLWGSFHLSIILHIQKAANIWEAGSWVVVGVNHSGLQHIQLHKQVSVFSFLCKKLWVSLWGGFWKEWTWLIHWLHLADVPEWDLLTELLLWKNLVDFSHMVSRIDPLSSDLGFSICDRVNPGICFIPYRSCSQATLVSCRLIFLWTVPNLTQGNLAEIICKHRKGKDVQEGQLPITKVFFSLNIDWLPLHA